MYIYIYTYIQVITYTYNMIYAAYNTAEQHHRMQYLLQYTSRKSVPCAKQGAVNSPPPILKL